jgi:hypothetical protein
MSVPAAEIESTNKEIEEYLSSHTEVDAASLAGITFCDFKKPIMEILKAVIHVGLSKIPLIPTQKIEDKLVAVAQGYLDKKCP